MAHFQVASSPSQKPFVRLDSYDVLQDGVGVQGDSFELLERQRELVRREDMEQHKLRDLPALSCNLPGCSGYFKWDGQGLPIHFQYYA